MDSSISIDHIYLDDVIIFSVFSVLSASYVQSYIEFLLYIEMV